MNNTPKSKYLLISIILFIISFSILLIFMLALALPYTERPLRHFPIPTPSPTPPDFTYLLPISKAVDSTQIFSITRFSEGHF
jgi:hypothetical protein